MKLKEILIEVAAKHSLKPLELAARSRTVAVVNARTEYFFRALDETMCSSVEIGNSLQMAHTTVLYGAARHAKKYGLIIPRGGVRLYQSLGASHA